MSVGGLLYRAQQGAPEGIPLLDEVIDRIGLWQGQYLTHYFVLGEYCSSGWPR